MTLTIEHLQHYAALLDESEIDRELVARGGLAAFIKLAWPILEPTAQLRWGWAMDALCEHLEAVSSGDIMRLLINIPPGCSKSLTTGVFWPAFEWGPGERPEYRIIGTSYSEAYATRDSRRMRDLVMSGWYQARWGHLVTLTQIGEKYFGNTRKGWRQAVPFRSLTGGRGHRVIVDDPHSTEQAESDADRGKAIRIFRESLPLRVVDPETSAIIVIMQRLHSSDVSGEIIAGDYGYEHLMLPMEFEPDRRCHTSIGFVDPRKDEGELLFPERFPPHVVERDKKALRAYGVAGQFQQRPAPREGGIVKAEWLSHRFRQRGARPRMVVMSLDCASKPKERNDPTALGVFACFSDRVELWHVDVRRHEFPDLVRWVKDTYNSTGVRGPKAPNAVLIEDKDAGQQLIQQLRRDTTMPIVACDPRGLDKVTRLDTETPFMESGNLWLPDDAPWAEDYVHEMITFPGAAHDDQADMTSQFLKWYREKGSLNRVVAPVSLTRPAPGLA